MKMQNKILAGFLTLCLLMALNGRECLASEAPPADSGTDHNTTYTITLYSGKQGTFTGAGDTGGQADSSGSRVVLKELEYGSMITFHPQDMVELAADSKYYVKGIRSYALPIS